MVTLLRLLSKIVLIVCGLFIGDMLSNGFSWLMFIATLACIGLHYLYLREGSKILQSKRSTHIHTLKLGDPKPEEMPEELWQKLQGLLEFTADKEDDEGENID